MCVCAAIGSRARFFFALRRQTMSIFSKIKRTFVNWIDKRHLEEALAEYVADSHHSAVMRTVREEFPELTSEMIPSGLVSSIVRCANERLLEHIV